MFCYNEVMKKISSFFKKAWQIIKSVPWYGWVFAVVIMGLQYGLYRLAPVIANATGSVNWAYSPKVTFDDMIPLLPPFVLFYVLSYALWVLSPVIISFTKKSNFINFVIGISSACIISFIIYIVAPSYMDRAAEGLIDIGEKGGFFNKFLQLIYDSDNGNMAYNLLPSLHCALSLYCYLGIHRQKEIPLALRISILVIVILIVLSTVFTKQHYILDVIAGLGITAIIFAVVQITKPGEKIINRHEEKLKTY